MRKFIGILVVLVSIYSCEFKDVDIEGLSNYKLESFQDNEAILSLDAKVLNENWFKIKIKASNLLVSIDGTEMGTLYLDKKIKIKGKRTADYNAKLRFKLSPGAMLKLLGLSSKKEVKINFAGKVKGGVFIFSKKFKVNETKTISPKDLNLNFLKGGE